MIECDNKVDMGVMDLSQDIFGKFKNIDLCFFNFVTNNNESLSINEIFVINSFHSLILGRITMCQNDLWNKLRRNICHDCCGKTDNVSPHRAINNLTSNSINSIKCLQIYDDIYMNKLSPSINPDWIEANKVCNLTQFDDTQFEAAFTTQGKNLEAQDDSNLEVVGWEGVSRLNNLQHTNTIPNQRIDKLIEGLPGIQPFQRIKLSKLFTEEDDGVDPKDLDDMDFMDDLLEDNSSRIAREPILNEHLDEIKLSRVLANLKISDPIEEHEFLKHIKISGSHSLQKALRALCIEYSEIFATSLPREAAKVKPLTIDIDLLKWESSKNCSRARLLTDEKEVEMKRQVLMRLDVGVLTESQAEYWSQVHMVPKGDGRWRMTIDFRLLNDCIKPQNWPLPRIDILIQDIGRSNPYVMGVVDMTDGYFQILLDALSRKLTAFKTKDNLYEWTRVPQGLKSASAHFQRAMETEVLKGLVGNILQVFLDDVCIHGKNDEEFVTNCRITFERFREYNIKLSPKKVRLGSDKEILLGHTISRHGWSFDREKLLGVNDFVRPTNAKQLHTFIGLCNYFRSHVKDASMKMKPLYDLMKEFKGQKILFWTPEAISDFEALKKAIFELPTLFFVDPHAEVIVQTDASDYGISGYVFQKIDGKEVIIAFFSQALHGAELRWSIFEKEAFAIFRTLKRFEYLLSRCEFILRTDHINLIYMNEHASRKVYAWKMWIQKFACIIEHMPGILNVVTDGGSRLAAPLKLNNISLNNVQVEGNECEEVGGSSTRSNTNSSQALREYDGIVDGGSLSLSLCNMRLGKESKYVHSLSTLPRGTLLGEKTSLFALSRGTLPVNITNGNAKTKFLDDERYFLIEKYHNNVIGHGGRDRTVSLIKSRTEHVDHVSLESDVAQFIKHCPLCQMMRIQNLKSKIKPFNISVYGPMDRLCIDLIGPLNPTSDGNTHILVILDNFSRFIQLHAVADTGFIATRKALVSHFGTFGSPREIVSDNAQEFNSNLCIEIMKFTGILHLKIMPYSHQENLCERANKEVMRFLRSMIFDKGLAQIWSEILPLVTRIYNSSVNKNIGTSPSAIIFGNSIDLDRGLILPHSDVKETTMSEYMERMLLAQRIIIEKTLQNQISTNVVQSNRKLKRDVNLPVVTFVKGSYVTSTYNDGNIPSKLVLPRRGPFRVLDHSEGKVHVQNLVTMQDEWIHASMCNQFLYDPNRVDPVGIARKALPSPEFLISKIIDHKPRNFSNKSKRCELFFLIEWEGFSEDHNSWEPWENLRNVELIHEYLKGHNMKYLIPKGFIV